MDSDVQKLRNSIPSGAGLRLTTELADGARVDAARRSSRVTARDVGPPEWADACRRYDDDRDDASHLDGAEMRSSAAVRNEADALSSQLHSLARAHDCDLAEQLRLLLRFDALEGYRRVGCASCIAWMNEYLGIGRSAAYERLRVARELESLPLIRALFRVGKLSWSKVRMLSQIADADNEEQLALAAIQMSVSGCEKLCHGFRHGRSLSPDEDDALALQAFERRSFRWRALDQHATEIRVTLPVDQAAEVIATLALFEDMLREEEQTQDTDASRINDASNTESRVIPNASPTASPTESSTAMPTATRIATRTARQRRADALLLMASRSISAVGEPAATADRYRVHVNVDSSALKEVVEESTSCPECVEPHAGPGDTSASDCVSKTPALPEARPHIAGFGPVAPGTARRIACDAGLTSVMTSSSGELLDVGRRTRVWPPAMRRAILARDGCCQVPGCGSIRHLDVHHLHHWADGGVTAASNGLTVCRRCHVMLHEGGFRLEPSTDSAERSEIGASLDDLPDYRPGEWAIGQSAVIVARLRRFRLVTPPVSVESTRVDSPSTPQQGNEREPRTTMHSKSGHQTKSTRADSWRRTNKRQCSHSPCDR